MLALLFSVLLFNDLDLLGVLFILYSTMEKALKNAIRDADIESSLAVPTFQFQKQRIELLRHLHSDSRRTTGVSTDLIRHMAEAILKQQDERGILTVLEDFEMDERGIKSRMKSFLRSSTEEELWLAAGKRASSLSDSEFLSGLRTIPVDHYLHEAAFDIEETAYAILARQVYNLMAGVVRETILSTQKSQCYKQIQRENEIKEDEELKVLWSKFVRQVKDVSTQSSALCVPYDFWNTDNLTFHRRIIVNVDHFEAKKYRFSRGLSKISLYHDSFSSLKQILTLIISAAAESFHKKTRLNIIFTSCTCAPTRARKSNSIHLTCRRLFLRNVFPIRSVSLHLLS